MTRRRRDHLRDPPSSSLVIQAPALVFSAKYEQLGWKRVESRSRPGEFSYENKYTGERIPDEPKYEASKLENKSKDLLEYE